MGGLRTRGRMCSAIGAEGLSDH